MMDDIEAKIREIVQPEQWKALQPLLSEAFKIDLSAFLVDFVMKQVDRRIYEPIFIEALKKPEELEQYVPGKDTTMFERAVVAFKDMRTGEPQKSFNEFLVMMQKVEIAEKIYQSMKSENDDGKLDEVEAVLIESQDIFK